MINPTHVQPAFSEPRPHFFSSLKFWSMVPMLALAIHGQAQDKPRSLNASDQSQASWQWLASADLKNAKATEVLSQFHQHFDLGSNRPRHTDGAVAHKVFTVARAALELHSPDFQQIFAWANRIADQELDDPDVGIAMSHTNAHHDFLNASVSAGDYEVALQTIEKARARMKRWESKPKPPAPKGAEATMMFMQTGAVGAMTESVESMHMRNIATHLGDFATVESEIRLTMSRIAESQRKQMALLKKLGSGDGVDISKTIGGLWAMQQNMHVPELAEALAKQGKFEEAEKLLQSLAPKKRNEKGDVAGLLNGLLGGARASKDGISIAEMWLAMGKPQKALEAIEPAIKGTKQVVGVIESLNKGKPNPMADYEQVATPKLQHTNARCLWALGKADECLSALDSALTYLSKRPSTHPDVISIRQMRCWCLLAKNKHADAAEEAARLSVDQQAMVRNLFGFANEQQRLTCLQQADPFSLLIATGQTDKLIADVIRLKGVVLDSVLEERRLAARSTSGEAAVLQQQLNEARTELAASIVSAAADADAQRAKTAALEFKLGSLTSSQPKARGALDVTLDQIKSAIGAGDVVLEFVRYRKLLKAGQFEPHFGVVVIHPDKQAAWVPLGAAKSLDTAVAKLLEHMAAVADAREASNGKNALAQLERALPAQLKGLFNAIMAPLLPHVETARRLVICPDGTLSQLAFAALLGPDERLAGERWAIAYVSTSRDLLQSVEAPTGARDMMIIADPDLKAASGDKDATRHAGAVFFPFDRTRLPQLGELPGSRQELAQLAALAKSQGLTLQTLVGPEAREAKVAGYPHGPTYLHFATHGLVLSPSSTIRQVPQGETVLAGGASAPYSTSLSDNPLQRSMLALAGASSTFTHWSEGELPPPEDDGVLTAQEIASLDLSRTWLTVLSACETAAGEPLAGEGVIGMRRGFFLAGVKHLAMTFWSIDDAETVALMTNLYEAMGRGAHPASALHEAQSRSLAKWREKEGLQSAVYLACPFAISVSGKLP